MLENGKKNWFTVLLAPKSRHLDAAWILLSSGTAPPLNVHERHDGIPVLGLLEHGWSREQFFRGVFETSAFHSPREWSNGYSPLPLDMESPLPEVPAFPAQDMDVKAWKTALHAREAIFARLVAMGANPWTSWTNADGETVDGFDLAFSWECTPLLDLCFRHPDCPPLETLHARTAWKLRQPPISKDEKGTPIFQKSDNLLTAAAASENPCLVEILINKGWNLEGKPGNRPPLRGVKNVKILEQLLQAGATWKPEYSETWQALAKRNEAHNHTLAKRMQTVVDLNVATSTTIDAAIANELLDAFLKNNQQLILNVMKSKLGEGNKLPSMKDTASVWEALDGARNKKRSLLLDVFLYGIRPKVSKEKIARCRNLIGNHFSIYPEKEIEGASLLGLSKLLTAYLKSKAKGTYSTHIVTEKTFDDLEPGNKVKTLIDTYKLVVNHANNSTLTDTRMIMMTLLEDLIDHAEIAGEHLVQAKDIMSSYYLGKKATRQITLWLQDQPINEKISWLPALINSESKDDIKKVLDQAETDTSWKSEEKLINLLHQMVKKFEGHKGFEMEIARIKRMYLETVSGTKPETAGLIPRF